MTRTTTTPSFIVNRYLIGEFFALFVPIMAAFVILYLIVNFFDRLDILLRTHATPVAAFRYFLFKVPLILTQMMPPAVITAMLLSLGLLSRRNEIIALRASGISLGQMALPLVGLAAVISLATLAWNETVVPYCTREFQYVNNVEIRKRPQRGILSDREIWYHGANGFYNIDHIDARRQTLFGLTIYRTDSRFDVRAIIHAASARWTHNRWVATGAVLRTIDAQGNIATRALAPDELEMQETLSDFLEVQRDPDELSYLALRARIRDLTRKGIDASNYLVDLYMKLALPFATLVLACVALPLAGRVQRHPSVGAIVGAGLLVGFSYWVVLGLTNSLGQSGVLPAAVAAWTSNVIFLLLAAALFLSAE